MRIVVVGGTGHIGSRLVTALQDCNQDVVVASPSSGVNTITGEGLAEALGWRSDCRGCVELSDVPG